ncbi:MAG TPA: hypothetical protein PLH84_13865, partial [Candidatus Krumholzibacteria bacterium]|nr:hypothetical protein [Candidatus Krumholzibacteria bacterium]
HSQKDLDGDGSFDAVQTMKLRRGRLRVLGKVNEKVESFFQTEVGDFSGSGQDMRLIDAWINYKSDPWAQFFFGLNMVPANRQNLTSSGGLMAIDRPGLAYKSLNWGGRSLTGFANNTFSPSSAGFNTNGRVRDLGITLFGSGDVGDNAHLKYYAGVYDGIQRATTDNELFSGRVQLNFGDAEGGYYNNSTYVGKKNTIGVGASFSSQKAVTMDEADDSDVDYSYISFDGFLEKPMGSGSVTAEVGYAILDFGDFGDLMMAQGAGFYGQLGYLVDGTWQPWFEYEAWTSDDTAEAGSYTSMRFGVTYFVQGHNANFKAGIEMFKPEVPFTAEEDQMMSAVFGAYVTY